MPRRNPLFLQDEQSRLSSRALQNRSLLGMRDSDMDLPLNTTTMVANGAKFPFMTGNGTALPENTESQESCYGKRTTATES